MKIVVVGASGNIGTALLHRLRDSPHQVMAVARRAPKVLHEEGIRWVACDAASESVGGLVEGADAVVNLAWLLQPSHRPDVTWANNIGVARRLLEAAGAHAVPTVLFASSVAAYSPREGVEPVTEEWPTHGASSAAYAREKAYIERMLESFRASTPECRVAWLRPSFVFQRHAATEQRRLFAGPWLPGRLLRPGLVPILPVPRGLMLQAIHASDVADAFMRILEGAEEGAFNLAARGTLDGTDIAALLDARAVPTPPALVRGALAAAWRLHAVPAPPTLFDALMRLPVMSIHRAEDRLGWHPTVPAAEALRDLLTGLQHGDHYPTPPLDSATSGPMRIREFRTGVGSKP